MCKPWPTANAVEAAKVWRRSVSQAPSRAPAITHEFFSMCLAFFSASIDPPHRKRLHQHPQRQFRRLPTVQDRLEISGASKARAQWPFNVVGIEWAKNRSVRRISLQIALVSRLILRPPPTQFCGLGFVRIEESRLWNVSIDLLQLNNRWSRSHFHHRLNPHL